MRLQTASPSSIGGENNETDKIKQTMNPNPDTIAVHAMYG